MGKEGDLWDDSALITAFDDAIYKYKKMHGKGRPGNTKVVQEAKNGTEEGFSICVDGDDDAKRQEDVDDDRNLMSNSTPDLRETTKDLPDKQHQQESDLNSSSARNQQDACQGYSKNQQCVEDYNQLLSRYYEMEEQRQKILQQLEHFGHWNFEESGPTSQWGTWGAHQQYSAATNELVHPDIVPPNIYPVCCNAPNQPANGLPRYPIVMNQPHYPAIASPCCPGFSHCVVAPCYLGGTCAGASSGLTSVVACNGQSTALEENKVTKAALEAAEKAISSLKIDNSGKSEGADVRPLEASAAGETDLNAVFNAWYSAGFYTGKYLAEHSIAKKHRG